MSKEKFILDSPKDLKNGLIQNAVELDYIFIKDDHIIVHTIQKNIIVLPMKPEYQSFINLVESDVKNVLELPDPVEVPPLIKEKG